MSISQTALRTNASGVLGRPAAKHDPCVAKYTRSEAGRKGGLTAPGPGKRRGLIKGAKLRNDAPLLLPKVDEARKVGRPPKLVANDKTWDLIEFLGSIGCTLNEIASALRVSKPTLLNFLTSLKAELGGGMLGPHERGFVKFKIALRRKQLALAETNGAVAIFLGKQCLGQKDVVEVKREIGSSRVMTEQEVAARITELAAKLGYRLVKMEQPCRPLPGIPLMGDDSNLK